MSTFHILNFGCRATQADGAAIERELLDRGLTRTDEVAASVVVLNTCTVTAAADADARSAIRRIHRSNPKAKILVTGCYAQRAPQEIAALPGVSWVVGNSHKSKVAGIVASGNCSEGTGIPALQMQAGLQTEQDEDEEPGSTSALISLHEIAPAEDPGLGPDMGGAQLILGDIFAHTEVLAAPVFEGDASASGFGSRTRANLKVQDGCDNRCSFCIIPFVRGNSRSLSAERVLAEADQLVRAGFQEIVLSGINLGRWGRDFEGARKDRFANLLRYLLHRTAIAKLRISSVEPMDWSDDLIALVAQEPRIAKHTHLPLQSGSDRILRAMHRKYRPWHYEEKITKLRAAMPDAAIGADVMVGFPGETEDLFRETYDFIAGLPFTYLHVFTFSPRPGTPAATLPDQVPVHLARERNRLLRNLIAQKNTAFRQNFVGGTLEAIVLSHSNSLSGPPGTSDALTSNFIKLTLDGDHAPNQWLNPQITGLTEAGLRGHVA